MYAYVYILPHCDLIGQVHILDTDTKQVSRCPQTLPLLSVKGLELQTTLKHAVERIVDRYVMVNEYLLDQDNEGALNAEVKSTNSNPHVSRISHDHNYCIPEKSATSESAKKKRKLSAWMVDDRAVSLSVQKKAPDGVFNYSSAILNDGLLLLELRDGVHFGAGPRVTRCWKFMLLHWRYAKHTKYSLAGSIAPSCCN